MQEAFNNSNPKKYDKYTWELSSLYLSNDTGSPEIHFYQYIGFFMKICFWDKVMCNFCLSLRKTYRINGHFANVETSPINAASEYIKQCDLRIKYK